MDWSESATSNQGNLISNEEVELVRLPGFLVEDGSQVDPQLGFLKKSNNM